MTREKFDYTVLKIGYHRFVMPRGAVLAFLDACVGGEVYKADSTYEDNQFIHYMEQVDYEDMPSMSMISPVQFHQMLENKKQLDERRRAKREAKEST
jgi:hypothetical protein